FVEVSAEPVQPPSVLLAAATEAMNRVPKGIEYPGAGKAAVVFYWDEEEAYEMAFLNPYTAEVLKVKDMNRDFFRIVVMGHFYLWLPPEIGQPIVATASLVFALMLISGVVLWWPRNRAARKQRFSLRMGASFKRLNYDLHNVLGFYASWV